VARTQSANNLVVAAVCRCEPGAMLRVRDLGVEVGGRLVVESATFTVMPRDKIGLVGRNGAGKTSLLRTLGGELEPAGGRVERSADFGYLPQDPRIGKDLEGRTPVTHVLSGRGIDVELERIEKLRIAMEERPDERNVERYTRAEEHFRTIGGYAAESEARRLMAGLGLSDNRTELPIGVLSGGERRRVELARILYGGSEVLCLDEPTNHLDVEARDWLLDFLRGYRGALVVVSHDLELLDEAITRVLHLDRPAETESGHLVEYRGTYSQYVAARAEDERRLARQAMEQARELARMQRFVDRFGAKATKAAAAHNMEKRIARLESVRVEAPRGQRQFNVRFPDPPQSGSTVVTVSGLCKGYGGPPVFEDIGFQLARRERLLVLGLNGAGKTSLLRILAGQTTADLGAIEYDLRAHVGYFAQEHEQVRPDVTLLDNLRGEVAPGVQLTETELRGLLGMFGLSGDKVFQDAGTLSGGEKTKLALAMLMVGRNNVLLLDEPTNNLDAASRDAVVRALTAWRGSIILVSHDTDFVRALVPTKVLEMPGGTVDYYDDSWLDVVALA